MVNLTISQTGSFVASRGLGSKVVTVPASGSATYSVATVDDSTDETNGSVTATLATGIGYTLHATNTSASVTVNDRRSTAGAGSRAAADGYLGRARAAAPRRPVSGST